jgi:hypothetical protein
MKKVYLIYDIFDDNEECTTYEYLQEICSSLDSAKMACDRLADNLLENYTNDGITAYKGVDDDGNIAIFRADNCVDHFTIEEWSVT